MAQFSSLLILFLSVFCGSVSCRTHGHFNLSIVQGYLNDLPKDGLGFFKQFAQRLEESEDYGECAEQIDALLTQRPDEAIRMFDAWTKIPSGILWSATYDFGKYDECMDIDFQESEKIRVAGKHCTYGLLIPLTTNVSKLVDADGFFKSSFCIPSKCNKTHIVKALNLSGVAESLINDQYCSLKRTGWGTAEILVVTFMIFIILLMILSTLYDVYLYYSGTKPIHPLYLAFSVYFNGKKLFHVASNKGSSEQILVLHGIKFISMCWIIAGHNGVIYELLPLDNYQAVKDWLQQPYTAYLQSAHLAVDTFFFVSGFLMAYLYFKSVAPEPLRKQVMFIPSSILHRYLRLTPALVIVFLFIVYIQAHLQTGPVTKATLDATIDACKNHWIAVFLYTQNYNNRKNLCMTNLWYVAADMQMFVCAPLILIPLAMQYKRKQFRTVMTELFILSVFCAFLPVYTKLQWRDYDPNFDEYDTHSRIVDYVMGMSFGIFMRRGNYNPNKITPRVNVILWTLALATMFSSVVINETSYLSNDYVHKTICFSLMRPLWCLGLCYVIWACFHGRGGIINWFLSCGIMQVGGKLTYAIYLVHGIVLSFWGSSIRENLHMTNFNVFYSFSGGLVVSMIISTLLSLGFESPMITIEKFIFGKALLPSPPKKSAPGHLPQH